METSQCKGSWFQDTIPGKMYLLIFERSVRILSQQISDQSY